MLRVPWTKTYAVDVQVGHDNFFPLNTPNRGELMHFILEQSSGALSGFDADLYYSKQALPDGSSSSSTSAASLGEPTSLDRSILRVLPTQTAGSGTANVEASNANYPYRNTDGTYSVPERKLYLRVNASGTPGDTKQFQLSLTIRMPF